MLFHHFFIISIYFLLCSLCERVRVQVSFFSLHRLLHLPLMLIFLRSVWLQFCCTLDKHFNPSACCWLDRHSLAYDQLSFRHQSDCNCDSFFFSPNNFRLFIKRVLKRLNNIRCVYYFLSNYYYYFVPHIN